MLTLALLHGVPQSWWFLITKLEPNHQLYSTPGIPALSDNAGPTVLINNHNFWADSEDFSSKTSDSFI